MTHKETLNLVDELYEAKMFDSLERMKHNLIRKDQFVDLRIDDKKVYIRIENYLLKKLKELIQ